MSKRLFIGIDMGSSALKLLAMNETRRIVAQSNVEYAISQPRPGWAEVDPRVWYDAMLCGLDSLLEQVQPSLVESIGVTGQMHTTVFVDKNGESIRPAIMWNDTRSAEMVPILKDKIVSLPSCAHIHHTLSTGSPAANLFWLSHHEPEHFARLHTFLIGPDYLVYKLSGSMQTDFCEASTSSLYDIVEQQWSPEMMRLLDMKRHMYPKVRGSAHIVGDLLPELVSRLGLREDVWIITGTGDNAATAVASGCLSGSFPVISLGTSGIVVYPTDSFKLGQKGKPILFSPDSTTVYRLVQGAVQSTGSSLSWWVQSILGKSSYERIDNTLAARSRNTCDLLFYPHLTGDKTIYADPDLRGAFIGIGSHTTKEDMTMAVIEGICYAFRELAEGMQVRFHEHPSVRVLGGGAKSKIWLQTLANVLNTKVERMRGEVSPAYGAALLAAFGTGFISDFSEITKVRARSEVSFVPHETATRIHQTKYKAYRRMYCVLKSVLDAMQNGAT